MDSVTVIFVPLVILTLYVARCSNLNLDTAVEIEFVTEHVVIVAHSIHSSDYEFDVLRVRYVCETIVSGHRIVTVEFKEAN
jgi:hypothetical protein